MHQNFYNIFHAKNKIITKFGTSAAHRKLKRSERMQINLTDCEGNLKNIGFFPESDEEDDYSLGSNRISSIASTRVSSVASSTGEEPAEETADGNTLQLPEPEANREDIFEKRDNIFGKLRGITPKDKAVFNQLLKYSKKPSYFHNRRKSVLPALKVKKKPPKKPGKVKPSTVRYSLTPLEEDGSHVALNEVKHTSTLNTIESNKTPNKNSKRTIVPKPVKPFTHRFETKLKCKFIPEKTTQHFDVSKIVETLKRNASKGNSFRSSDLSEISHVKEKLLAKLKKRLNKLKKAKKKREKNEKKAKKVKSGKVESLTGFEVRHLPSVPVKYVERRSRPRISDNSKSNEEKAKILAEKFQAELRKRKREDERIRIEKKRIEEAVKKEREKMKFEVEKEDASLKEKQKRKMVSEAREEDEVASYSSYEVDDDRELKKNQMAMEKTYERLLRRANGAENDASSKDSREALSYRRMSMIRDDYKPHEPPPPLVEVVVPKVAPKPEAVDSHSMLITLNKESVKAYKENDIDRVSELSGVRVDSSITFFKVGKKVVRTSHWKPKYKRLRKKSVEPEKSSLSHEPEFEEQNNNNFEAKPSNISNVSKKKQEMRVSDEVQPVGKKNHFSHLRASVFTRKKRSITNYPSRRNTITLRNYKLKHYDFKHDKRSKSSKNLKKIKSTITKISPPQSNHKSSRPNPLSGIFSLSLLNQLEPDSDHFKRKPPADKEGDFMSKFKPEELAKLKKLIPKEYSKLPEFSPEALRKIASPQPKELNADEKNIISTMKRAHELTMESFFASFFF